MFFEDAEVGARVLDIQLTSRSKDGVPLCGVPYHAAEPYIAKLVKAGHKVAICEQGAQEKGADGKPRGIMTRQIVRVITPGTVGEETVLVAGEKNYLVAIVSEDAKIDLTPDPFPQGKGNQTAKAREEVVSDRLAEQHPHPRGEAPRRPRDRGTSREGEGVGSDEAPYGTAAEEAEISGRDATRGAAAERPGKTGGYAVAAIDVSTGEFIAARIANRRGLIEELARLAPREIVIFADDPELKVSLEDSGVPLTVLDAGLADQASAALAARFGAEVVVELGEPLGRAAGAALGYVEGTSAATSRICGARALSRRRVHAGRRGHPAPSGTGRLERRRAARLAAFDARRDADRRSARARWPTGSSIRCSTSRRSARATTRSRSCSKPTWAARSPTRSSGSATSSGWRAGSAACARRRAIACSLAQALAAVAALRESAGALRSSALIRELAAADRARCPSSRRVIDATIGDEPPVNPRDGNLIRAGLERRGRRAARARLGRARRASRGWKARERERSKIPLAQGPLQPGLRLLHRDHQGAPRSRAGRLRAQTDAGRRRTLHHARAQGARAQDPVGRSRGSRNSSCSSSPSCCAILQAHTAAILADRARDRRIRRARSRWPGRAAARLRAAADELGLALTIRDGRHPVLEAGMSAGEFVPNDLDVDPDKRQLLLITGPNMAGKSTYLRQVALIVIMAQMGSFVPATEASIGIVDSVLTRIGARDELRRGESTFMVEMRETARLLEGPHRAQPAAARRGRARHQHLRRARRSRGRWPNICTTRRAPRCCSRPISMS